MRLILFVIITGCFILTLPVVQHNNTRHVMSLSSGKAYAYYGVGRRIARRTARRTARRVVRRHSYYRAPAAVVYGAPAAAVAIGATFASLPSGCTSLVINGLTYYHCGGTYYQAAYDGPNIVYVVVDPPR